MLSGKPGSGANTASAPAFGPGSQSLRILQVVVSATGLYLVPRRWQMQCLEVKPSLLYLINLPVLSTSKTAAKNCLVSSACTCEVYHVFMLINVPLVKRNGFSSASVTKGLAKPPAGPQQEGQNRHPLCKDHWFFYRNANLMAFHTHAPTLAQKDERTSA